MAKKQPSDIHQTVFYQNWKKKADILIFVLLGWAAAGLIAGLAGRLFFTYGRVAVLIWIIGLCICCIVYRAVQWYCPHCRRPLPKKEVLFILSVPETGLKKCPYCKKPLV